MSDARKSQPESMTPRGRVAERAEHDDALGGAGFERLETRHNHVLRNARAMIFELGAAGELTYISPGRPRGSSRWCRLP